MKSAIAEFRSVPAAQRLRALLANDLIMRLVAGFGVGITTRVGILVMEVIIGRKLSPDGYGTFSFTIGLVTLSAALGSLGWLDAITRYVARFVVERRWGALRGALIRSQQIVLASTTIIGIGIGVTAWVLPADPVFSSCLFLAALCLPLIALKQLRCCQIQGLNRPKLGMFLNEGAIALLVIPMLFLVTLHSPATAVGIYLVMTLVVLFVADQFFRHYVPTESVGCEPEFHTREWTLTGLSLTAGQSFGILRRVDVLIIAPFLGWTATGWYVSAFRIALALQCIPMVIDQIVRPLLANAWYANDIRRVKQIFWISLLASSVLAVPLGSLLLMFPAFTVKLIFGGPFAGAVPLLVVFVISQTVNAMTGPVGGFLAMTGHERQFGTSSLIVAAINLVMMLIATPMFGLMGAALSAASGILVLNLIHLWIAITALNARIAMTEDSA